MNSRPFFLVSPVDVVVLTRWPLCLASPFSFSHLNCAPNSGVEHVSRPEGCDLNAEGLWALSRILHAMWMHHFSSTRSPLVPYLMRAPFLGQGLGPSRAEVGFGSRLVGCVRRFCAPPPPLVGFWPVVRPLFLFPCPFRVCPFRARCVGVGVFSFPFPFCVPPLVFRLSNCHFIFIVISFPFLSFSPSSHSSGP